MQQQKMLDLQRLCASVAFFFKKIKNATRFFLIFIKKTQPLAIQKGSLFLVKPYKLGICSRRL
jgi:hypothetical protein